MGQSNINSEEEQTTIIGRKVTDGSGPTLTFAHENASFTKPIFFCYCSQKYMLAIWTSNCRCLWKTSEQCNQ